MLDERTRPVQVLEDRLANAGFGAYIRYDMAAAANLLSRALSLLPRGHSRRQRVLRQLSAAYQQIGKLHEADAALADLLLERDTGGDQRVERAIRLERTRIGLFTGPDPVALLDIRQDAERALRVTGASDDELAQACHVLGLVHLRAGAVSEMERIAQRGLDHADRSGNPRDELAARWTLAWALEAGVRPIPDCIRLCEALARWRGREHPGVLCVLGSLRAARGQFDQARALTDRGQRLMQEWMQVGSPLVFAARSIATVPVLAGDFAGAERALRTGLDAAKHMGIREQTAELAARLSQILTRHGACLDAERLAALSRQYAPAESVTAQALWRAAGARVLATRERGREAENLAREAVQLPPVDMLGLRADLLTNLAETLLATGQRAAALTAATDAVDLYERKGNVVAAAQARRLRRSPPRLPGE